MLLAASSRDGLPGILALQTAWEIKHAIAKVFREVRLVATKLNPETVPNIVPSALGRRGLNGILVM